MTMNNTRQKVLESYHRSANFKPAALLFLAGIGLAGGNMLSLTGFAGWMTLLLAAASLLLATALCRNHGLFSIPAVVVAVEGSILCSGDLSSQLSSGEFFAAIANLAVIVAMISAAALILRLPHPG